MSSVQTSDVKQPDINCLQNGHRSEKETPERHLKEREFQSPTISQSAEVSLSLASQNPYLDSLTSDQADFWTCFCAISGQDHIKLNKNAYTLVTYFAPLRLTTDDIQSLHDLAYKQIRAFAKSKGIPEEDIKPPRLGNLKNAYPDWQAMRKQSEKLPEEDHHHLPGTGEIHNVTRERLAGNGPKPLTYAPLPTQRRNRTRLEKIDASALPATRKRDHP